MKKMMSFLLMLSVSGFASTASNNPSWGAVQCIPPWEMLDASDYVRMCRLAVPHGWLILNINSGDSKNSRTIFISDESHEWVLTAN